MKTLNQDASTHNSVKSNLEKAEYWKQHKVLQKESGLSKKGYCEANGLNYHTFSYWYQKVQIKPSSLIPVVLATETAASAILCSIKLNSEFVLNIHSMDVVSELLRRTT